MDPLTIAGLGIQGFGAIQGMMQGNAQARAARDANNIAMLQYLEQRRQAEEALTEGRATRNTLLNLASDGQYRYENAANAERLRQEGRALADRTRLEDVAIADRQRAEEGSVDARGNTVRYIPGRGWVTILSDNTQRLLNASDTEEYQRNTGDAAQSRLLRQAIARRQNVEGNVADVTLAERRLGGRSQEATEAALLGSKAARALAANRALQRGINMQSLRQGSGGEVALAELGRSGLEDVRTAIADARLEGAPQFVAERAAREGANNASYSLFASRASNPMANTYTPSMAAAETSGSLEAGRGLANNSTQNRLQALNSNSQSLMQGSNAAAMARLAALSGNTQNLMQAYGGGSQAVQQAISNGMNIRAPNMQFAEDRTPVAIAGIGSAFMGAGSLYNQYQKRNAGGSSTFGDPVMEQARLMRGNPT